MKKVLLLLFFLFLNAFFLFEETSRPLYQIIGIQLVIACVVFFLVREQLAKANKLPFFADGLEDCVLILDNKGKVLEINQKATILFPNIRRGKNFFNSQKVLDKDQVALCQSKHQAMLRSKEKESYIFPISTKKNWKLQMQHLSKEKKVALLFQRESDVQKVEGVGKDFVANASHELRTPITIIKGFAETLKELPEISEAMLEDITEKIVRNCDRMQHLVKNLLLLADLDHIPKTNFQECDLVSLIDSICLNLYSLHPSVKMETYCSDEVIVIPADVALLERAIGNLLENSIKYSSKHPEISIYVEKKKNEVCIRIKDKGVGIEKEDLDKIFNRFYTVNKAHSRSFGGAGLGLSLVKTIIEKHGGQINVSSTPGKGTIFVITFQQKTLHS